MKKVFFALLLATIAGNSIAQSIRLQGGTNIGAMKLSFDDADQGLFN